MKKNPVLKKEEVSADTEESIKSPNHLFNGVQGGTPILEKDLSKTFPEDKVCLIKKESLSQSDIEDLINGKTPPPDASIGYLVSQINVCRNSFQIAFEATKTKEAELTQLRTALIQHESRVKGLITDVDQLYRLLYTQ